MEDKIYTLAEQLENCTHAKVNFQIDEEHLNCDLGCFEEVNSEIIFVAKYTSAVIHNSSLINYAGN